jgi:hypothetical protein
MWILVIFAQSVVLFLYLQKTDKYETGKMNYWQTVISIPGQIWTTPTQCTQIYMRQKVSIFYACKTQGDLICSYIVAQSA